MKRILLVTTLAAAGLGFAASEASAAGRIERACQRSDRAAATPALCNCIQQVADMTLSSSDQRRAVRFFSDPHEAQQIRASKKAADSEFWARYRNFGASAEAYCAVR